MAPKLLWITIIHVLLWNFIFSLTESIELNEDEGLLLNRLGNRVRYTTHICDRLKNSPPVVNHNNYESLPNSHRVVNSENSGLAKDLSEPSNSVKRHAILRCYNRPAQENNEPNKPDLITSEWQMKSTPVDNAYSNLYEHPTVADLQKIYINSQKVIDPKPLYHTVPLLQKRNFTEKNPKHSPLQLNLQEMTKKIKSLISTPQHKLGEVISDKLIDESLHSKLAQPSLTQPSPPKLTKYPVVKPNSDNLSNPLTLSPLLPQIPNNNFDLQKDFIIENKPFLSLTPIQLNKPKPVDLLYDRHVPPMAYRPTLPSLIHTPVIKPTFPPILLQKESPIPTTNERPQGNIGSTFQYPKIIKNGIAEPTSQPILIEKKVSIYLPYKKQQELINLSPLQQFFKTPDTKTVRKPITIEKEVSTSVPKEQEQAIVDLPSQAPQVIQTPDKQSNYQETSGQTIVSANVPYGQSTISLSSPPQINEYFNSESTPQIIPSDNEVSISSTYGQQQPIVSFSTPSQLQQIKIQNEISTPLPYTQQTAVAPLKLVKAFNTELLSKKQNSLYDQQQPITLPSPPPLTKTTTSAYGY
ncbi:hypothetical protein ACI65C_010235 [Semiaphis heraclei]